MDIRNLEHTGFETLFRGFETAFSDYDIHFDKEEVRSMLRRRGYDPRLSFAAFDNDEIVAFTLNGIGTFNGIPTAYDTGTGTVKEHRGEGLAGKIFTHAEPYLREAGVRQYLLEVLQNNRKAIAVYRRMKFEVTREFDCYRQAIADIQNADLSHAEAACEIRPVSTDIVIACQSYCDFNPSWQNSIESIERGKDGLICLGAFIADEPAGYCVSDANTGDIAQLAVSRNHRRKGVGSQLLREATALMKTGFIKVLNVSSKNDTMPAFLEKMNIPLSSRQYEMILPL